MKRILLLAPVAVFLAATTVSADYIQIKIDINQMNFYPPPGAEIPGQNIGGGGQIGQPPPPPGPGPGPGGPGGIRPGPGGIIAPGGGMFGFMGGGPGGPGLPGAEEPQANAKWVSAWVEGKFLEAKSGPMAGEPMPIGQDPRYGLTLQFSHKNRNYWVPFSLPGGPVWNGFSARIKAPPFQTTFNANLLAATKDPSRNVEKYLILARVALERGRLPEFRKAMEEAVKLDPKQTNVVNYLRVQKEYAKTVKTTEDTAQKDLLDELHTAGYRPKVSDEGHYALFRPNTFADDPIMDAMVRRRLVLLEETLETFYYWFAVQKGDTPQPAFPKTRLTAVLCPDAEYLRNHAKWNAAPTVADGFTPRRDNVIVMSVKSRMRDPNYAAFDKEVTKKLDELNVHLAKSNVNVTRDSLLTGRILEKRDAKSVGIFVGAAQMAVLLSKTLEDEAERATVSHEGVRQLLVASDMFPRNVQIPEWMVEGIAAMFETPVGAIYPTIGRPSWTHLIAFRHLRTTKQLPEDPADVMFNVVTDRYFHEARQLASEAQDNPKSDALRIRSQRAWEVARSTSWSFVYFLKYNRKLDYLFRYGQELNKLPRDMDLDNLILQRCFAEAFDMKDPRDPRRIERVLMGRMASDWFKRMEETNHELLMMRTASGEVAIQNFLLDQRAKLDKENGIPGETTGTPTPPGGGATSPPFNPNPGGGTPPQPPFNPNPGGGTTTPPGGGTVTPPGGGTVTPPGGGTLTPPGGGTVTPPKGGTVVPPGGGGTVTPPQGGTVVPPGGGTLTPPGGGTVTPPQGGTVVPPGGGTVTPPQGGTVVPPGGPAQPTPPPPGRLPAPPAPGK